MNRIGGPSGLPHSRTCSRKPPPPRTVWVFIRPVRFCSSVHSCHLLPPRARRIDAIVAVEEPERIGRSALSFAAGRRIFGAATAYERLATVGCAILAAWRLARARSFVGRARELGRARARARCGAGGKRRDRARRRRGGHRQDPARLRARARAPATRASRSSLGRSIDLVGTELPYQPFVEALRPLGEPRQVDGQAAGSQLRVFEETLALLAERAAVAPVLLVLEDLHWADSSTLDLVVFLAHNLDDRPVLLLATYRADELSSAERMRRLADGVRRSGSALVLELGPLAHDELTALLAAHADAPLPAALTDTIVARSEGNPFFAEELLAAAGDDQRASSRVACATCCCSASPGSTARRRACCAWPRRPGATSATRCCGRSPALPGARPARVASPGGRARRPRRRPGEGSFRFRHALLAEAIYATILPGEREELHARLADELARSGAASPAELAPHWAAAGRNARGARRVGRSGAPGRGRLRPRRGSRAPRAGARALATRCRTRPSSPGSTSPSSAPGRPSSPADVGAAPRAVELGRRAIELVGERRPAPCGAPPRAPRPSTSTRPAVTTLRLAALERAVELVPAEPPSPERAYALGVARGGIDGGLAPCGVAADRRAGARARSGRRRTRGRGPSAHRARRRPRLPRPRRGGSRPFSSGPASSPRRSAITSGLERAYVQFHRRADDAGTAPRVGASGAAGLEAMRRYGIDSALLVSNQIEALLAIGDWDEAERLSAAALRGITSSYPYVLLITPRRRRDRPRRVRRRASAPRGRERHPARGPRARPLRRLPRRPRPLGAPLDRRGRGRPGRSGSGAPARGRADPRPALRQGTARTGGAGSARTRPSGRRRRSATGSAARGSCSTSLAAPRREASAITPNAAGWLAVAEAEHERARGDARPEAWSDAAATWERLERPPLAAYCRWREAEALVAVGASRTEASVPLRRGARRRGPDRSNAPAARARAARRTSPARSRAA